MLNFHRLRILREIAERGTVSAAAKALWMSPSSVSQHMTALEAETGVVLLERVGRRVRLTPAAHRLVAHTENMLADMERAEADLALAREQVVGRLAISAFPTAARTLMIPAAIKLMREHPGLTLDLTDLEQPESFTELRSGNLDIAVGLEYTLAPATQEPGLELEPLLSEPVYLAMSPDHPLAEKPVRLEDLRADRWFAARGPSPCRQAVLRATAYAGFEPRVELLDSADYDVILTAVSAGLGVTLVPYLALAQAREDVVIRPLDELPLRRNVYAAVREGSRTAPPIAAAIDAMLEVAKGVSAKIENVGMHPRG